MKLLITSAIPAELEPLAVSLEAQKTPWGWETDQLRLLPLGIGPLEAQSTLLRFEPNSSAIWFVGTAGFFDPNAFHIGQLVQAAEVSIFDGTALLGHGHFAALAEHRPFQATGDSFGLQPVSVANSLSVTSSNQLARLIHQQIGAEVENLELFGVAQAAQALEVPWTGILGLTNQVGPSGSEQWHQQHKTLAQKTADFLAEHISHLDKK